MRVSVEAAREALKYAQARLTYAEKERSTAEKEEHAARQRTFEAKQHLAYAEILQHTCPVCEAGPEEPCDVSKNGSYPVHTQRLGGTP